MKKVLGLVLLSAALPIHAGGSIAAGGNSAEEAGAGQASAETSGGDRRDRFYVGADLQSSTLTVSSSQSFAGLPADSYRSRFWDLRAGYRVLRMLGVEAHCGITGEDLDSNPGRYQLRNYYGFYAVPTANVFNLFELAFPVGYTSSGISTLVNGTTNDEHLGGIAYGARVELPVRLFSAALPDIRISGGGMALYQRSDAREYGFNLGLRYDFGLGRLGG